MRSEEWWWRLRRDPSTQVAAVLAFVISHTTFLAAQDDETGRCPKADFSLLPEEGGRKDGLGDARSLKLAVFSYRKPNPQLLIPSY